MFDTDAVIFSAVVDPRTNDMGQSHYIRLSLRSREVPQFGLVDITTLRKMNFLW